MLDLKTSTAVLALLGTGYYGYSSLHSEFSSKFDLQESKFNLQEKLIADQDKKIHILKHSLAKTHESLVFEKSNRMEQMDQVKTMIEDDKAGAEKKQLYNVNQDVTDAWVVQNNLASQRAWEYQDQYVVYYAWKTSPSCNLKIATKSIYDAESAFAMYQAYDSPTIIWRNGQILKQHGDRSQVMACKFLADYGFEFSNSILKDQAAELVTLNSDHDKLRADYAALEQKVYSTMTHLNAVQKTTDAAIDNNTQEDAALKKNQASIEAAHAALANVQSTQHSQVIKTESQLAAHQKASDAEIDHNESEDAALNTGLEGQEKVNSAQHKKLVSLKKAVKKNKKSVKTINKNLAEAAKHFA